MMAFPTIEVVLARGAGAVILRGSLHGTRYVERDT